MGKFITEEKNIVDTYLNNFINNTTDFSKYIEGSPTFVTYYSKDVLASTSDITLGGTKEIIGVESPIRFNRISNFPLFNMEEFNLDTNLEEDSGIDSELQSSAIVLPNIIKPLTDDYFQLTNLNKDFLFRITDVEPNNINDKVFYKINFQLSYEDIRILEEKQLTKNYKVLYENIGKEAKSVVLEDNYASLENLYELYDTIKNFYIKYYYNKDCNLFFYNDGQNYYYDNSLMKFIDRTNIFIKNKSYMENIKIVPNDNDVYFDFNIYNKTLFNSLETKVKDNLINFSYFGDNILKEDSMLELYRNKYSFINMNYIIADNNKDNGIFNKKFYNCLINNLELQKTELNENDKYYSLLNIIIKYINNDLIVEQFIKELQNYNFDISIQNYILIPCILFIIKQSKEIILNR